MPPPHESHHLPAEVITRPQPSSGDGGGLSTVREQLGLPRIGTARPFALAMIIDAVGSGLFLPFSLLYFH
jgi:hypothetical protein